MSTRRFAEPELTIEEWRPIPDTTQTIEMIEQGKEPDATDNLEGDCRRAQALDNR